MVFRNFDDSQWQNKVETLEARIRELEEENKQLKERIPVVPPGWENASIEHLRKAVEKNPEFFMSTKEKKALKKDQQEAREKIAESMGLSLKQYNMLVKSSIENKERQ